MTQAHASSQHESRERDAGDVSHSGVRPTTSAMAMVAAAAFGFAAEGVLEVTPTDAITDSSELELDGARGVGIFMIGERTYAAVAAYYDHGVEVLDVTDPDSPARADLGGKR